MEIEAIQKLIEIDKQTRKKVEEVHQKKFELKQKIDEEKKQLSVKAWDETNKQLGVEKEKLDQQTYEMASATQASFDQNSARLKKTYEMKKEAWVDLLMQRVIGDDSLV